MTRESHNCAGTAFVQGDSAGCSTLSEQTSSIFYLLLIKACPTVRHKNWGREGIETVCDIEITGTLCAY